MPEASAHAEGDEPVDHDQAAPSPDPPSAPSDAPDAAPSESPAATGVIEIVQSLDDEQRAEDVVETDATAERTPESPDEPAASALSDAGAAGDGEPSDTVEPQTAEVPPLAPDQAATTDEWSAPDDAGVVQGSAQEQGAEVAVEAEPAAEVAPAQAVVTTPQPLPEAPPAAEAAAAEKPVPWWPFAVYGGMWIAGLGVALYYLLQVPPGQPVFESAVYGLTVVGGLALTALGPVMILLTWFALWVQRGKGHRAGLFTKVAIYGALCTLAGVILWWGVLLLLDTLRLGRLT